MLEADEIDVKMIVDSVTGFEFCFAHIGIQDAILTCSCLQLPVATELQTWNRCAVLPLKFRAYAMRRDIYI
jgi:hypothetical protein